ncbi:nuclear transport factor 2 family protein [Chitinophaga sp. RAB17]|uniref:nuclear transport factor 2 family protein n=1 Tax=Chitinophaga sp. RAB17 TaxID=3233049 RepID=UPI003F93EA36
MEDFKARVAAFHHLVGQGKFMEALDQYYDENVSSADNDGPAINGLEALRKAATGFLGNTTDMKMMLENSIVIDNYSVAQWHYQFTNSKIGAVNYRQISVAHWKAGKIIKEQHLHNVVYQG